MWIEYNVDAAGVFVFVEDIRPGLPAVGGTKDPALLVWAKGMAKSSDQHDVRILRVNNQCANLMRVAQSYVFPVLPAIDRFVNGIAANGCFAGADVNGVVIRGRHCDRANGGNVILIKEWRPIRAAIRRFPNPARHRAEVPGIGFARHALNGQGAAAAKGPDLPPLHPGEKFRIDLRRWSRGGARRRRWRSAYCTG